MLASKQVTVVKAGRAWTYTVWSEEIYTFRAVRGSGMRNGMHKTSAQMLAILRKADSVTLD